MLVLVSYVLLALGTLEALFPLDWNSRFATWPEGYVPMGSFTPGPLETVRGMLEAGGIKVELGDVDQRLLPGARAPARDELWVFVPLADVGKAVEILRRAFAPVRTGPGRLTSAWSGRGAWSRN